MIMDKPVENTDTHLFYEDHSDEGYSPSCHMTKDRKLGIQVGGHVIVMPLRSWHHLQKEKEELERQMYSPNMSKALQIKKLQKENEELQNKIKVMEETCTQVAFDEAVNEYNLEKENEELRELLEKAVDNIRPDDIIDIFSQDELHQIRKALKQK
jgi:hypothetical protein